MLTFLFWNVNKRNLSELATKIAREHHVDLIFFAEPPEGWEANLLDTINTDKERQYILQTNETYNYNRRFTILSRFPRGMLQYVNDPKDERRYTILRLLLPGEDDILLIAVHLRSKLRTDGRNQAQLLPQFIRSINEVENRFQHSRTMVFGDFNMNPFEDGFVSCEGLHAVQTRLVANKYQRIVQKERYRFFYNPMWNFFGDTTIGPPGTHYYDNSDPINFFWNLFDQVIVRPDLLDRFRDEDVSILTSAGEVSLLNDRSVPDSKISDHLPIIFGLR